LIPAWQKQRAVVVRFADQAREAIERYVQSLEGGGSGRLFCRSLHYWALVRAEPFAVVSARLQRCDGTAT